MYFCVNHFLSQISFQGKPESERNGLIIDHLRKKTKEHYRIFCNILRTNHSDLVDTYLEPKANTRTQDPTTSDPDAEAKKGK